MNVDPKVQRIIDWRESFVTLPDSHFFELIRMYLGEIHSPFNKQKLVEQLGGFLRKEENRKKIVSLLSETDLLILSAVHFIPKATNEKLSAFMTGSMTFASLYERLLNLEERLLIYRHADSISKKTIISINPTLEDVLLPLLSKRILLPQPVLETRACENQFTISAEKIAGFINYINFNPGLCKNDGNLKKHDIEKLETVFGAGCGEFFNTLMNSFINLSLVQECTQGYEINRQRMRAFAELDGEIQYAYLCVSACARFSRGALLKQAKLLLETINSIPATGFSLTSILRLSFLISENSADIRETPSGGRFASILAKASRETENSENQEKTDCENTPAAMENLCRHAEIFGLLRKYGTDENKKPVFVKGAALSQAESANPAKVLNADAAFNVTVFPGLNLKRLFPLMSFMELKKFDTGASFEITRKTVMRAFDEGLKAPEIISLMEQFSLYGIPENLKQSLEDWAKSYSSASLFKGYILKIDEKNTVMVENNPVISQYIYEKLAPGIFLLNVHSDEEAETLIKNSSLDYIGKIQRAVKEIEGSAFPAFSVAKNPVSALFGSPAIRPSGTVSGSLDGESGTDALPATEEERKAHFDYLRGLLDKMAISVEQREGLLLRINRKIILTPGQLNADSVKLEQIEANGMDYQGKVHVAESAVAQNMMLELRYDDAENGTAVIVGTPVSVEKNPIDAAVNMIVEPDRDEKSFSLGQAKNVRRIRGDILR